MTPSVAKCETLFALLLELAPHRLLSSQVLQPYLRHSWLPHKPAYPYRPILRTFEEEATATRHSCDYKDENASYLTLPQHFRSFRQLTMAERETRSDGQCVMRGSCGKKGWIGAPLPCPYDGPPIEVSRTTCICSFCSSQFYASASQRIRTRAIY